MDSTLIKPRILYIDDIPEARALVTRLLGEIYIVLEASEPLSGIELAVDTNPDLVLLDLNLPQMSGLEIASRLKTLLPNTPIVALTADAMPGTRERALAAGCVGFLSKPIDIDTFPHEIQAYLDGKEEKLDDETGVFTKAVQAEMVKHLEEKVRELTKAADLNKYLHKQNQHIINQLKRRQSLLEAAARVGRSITSILNLDRLLRETVDIICEEYGLYFAGIFILDAQNNEAVLRAGRGEAGKEMIQDGYKLDVNARSMIGRAILSQESMVSSGLGEDNQLHENPYLPRTRSMMTLPLVFKDIPLGALSVQSEDVDAFTIEDLAALQLLADQVAVAIHNAELLRELDAANREIVRTKTFEAIANATGEAIHWVGNRATPIPESARRVREDMGSLLAMFQTLLELQEPERSSHPFWPVVTASLRAYAIEEAALPDISHRLSRLPVTRLKIEGDVESMLEDLDIIEQSASTILNIKEDLLGPAREQTLQQTHVSILLRATVKEMGLPVGIVQSHISPTLPTVLCDPMQINRVFNNLIKNAWEALQGTLKPKIILRARRNINNPEFVEISVSDNGPGIPPDLLDKIWVPFFTTKGNKGGTGLGLAACLEIVKQSGGTIWAENPKSGGASFHIMLPTNEAPE